VAAGAAEDPRAVAMTGLLRRRRFRGDPTPALRSAPMAGERYEVPDGNGRTRPRLVSYRSGLCLAGTT